MNEKIIESDQEKENLQSKIEKLEEQLEQEKMQCEKINERKTEAELSLKTEIKFLISKLTKTKTKLEQNIQNARGVDQNDMKTSSSNFNKGSASKGGNINLHDGTNTLILSSQNNKKSENRYTKKCYPNQDISSTLDGHHTFDNEDIVGNKRRLIENRTIISPSNDRKLQLSQFMTQGGANKKRDQFEDTDGEPTSSVLIQPSTRRNSHYGNIIDKSKRKSNNKH